MLRRVLLAIFVLSIAGAALAGCGSPSSAVTESELKMAPMSMMPDDVKSAALVTRQAYQFAVAQGVLLRPLGDTLYLFPPLNTPADDLQRMRDVLVAAGRHVAT